MPDRYMGIVGAPNFSAMPYASAITSAYPGALLVADMPLSNLLTDEPSDVGRILTRDPLYTFFQVGFEYSGAAAFQKSLGGMGLVNVNCSRWGHYRVVGSAGLPAGPVNLYERVAPNGEADPTNRTGSVSDVDEDPLTPDGNWMAPTAAATPWSTRLLFGTPAVAPRTGSNRQAFVLWVRRQGSDATVHPIVKAWLYEDGSELATLGTKVVTSATGQTIVFRWDASLLATASGANVELRVQLRGNSNATAQLGAVSWQCDSVDPLFDSGWIASPFGATSAFWGGTSADEAGPEPTKNLEYLPASPWDGVKHFSWLLSDDGADADADGSFASFGYAPASAVTAPPSYIQAGAAPAGPLFMPSVLNFARGPLVSARSLSTGGMTLGGQRYGSRRRQPRTLPVRLSQTTEAEGYSLFDRLDLRKGKDLPVLVVKFPDGSDASRRLTSAWVTLEDMPGLEIPSAHERLSWSGVFVEKL